MKEAEALRASARKLTPIIYRQSISYRRATRRDESEGRFPARCRSRAWALGTAMTAGANECSGEGVGASPARREGGEHWTKVGSERGRQRVRWHSRFEHGSGYKRCRPRQGQQYHLHDQLARCVCAALFQSIKFTSIDQNRLSVIKAKRHKSFSVIRTD